MNLLRRELRANRKTLIIWTAALSGLNILMMALFPAFAEDAEALDSLIKMYPEGFLRAFGLDVLSLADPIGFYATEAYFMIVLFGGIFAAILGSTLLSKEEDDKTIEFLLAKPITRSRILTEKIICFILYIALFNIIIDIVTFASFEVFVTTEYSQLLLLYLLSGPFFAHLTFASIAFLLALFFAGKKSAYSASIGLVLVLYFFDLIATLTEQAEFLRCLSPFYYINAVDIVVNEGIDIFNILVLLAVCLLVLLITYVLYNKRDITV
ncbi:Efflux ABC transporter, permease protein [Candidatus Syntrophocurvum alkaliphilum]|uniref:Efflux ABC transporter, permease protein n=1 Tax=Candidatus Syntrophocurvum alkaliphilum TaxID=2293317 RepID=A0A6I6D5F3_9FIRM|nr:ABC transporter permease subunit [Candidatus Syntrophocurvum alkaliphilum]QGT98636.1 Efflux ABC transporter, permease protein [Candidatus Syntrophocurvum alkaliphilum]